MIPSLAYKHDVFEKPNKPKAKQSGFDALPEELIREVFSHMNVNYSQIFNKASSEWVKEEQLKVCKQIKESHLGEALFPDLLKGDFAKDEKASVKNLELLNKRIKNLWGKFQDGELIFSDIQQQFGSPDLIQTFEYFDKNFNELATQVLELPTDTKYGYNTKILFAISLLLISLFAGLILFAHIYFSPILLLGLVFLVFGIMGALFNRIRGEQFPLRRQASIIENALGRNILDIQKALYCPLNPSRPLK